MSGRRAPHLQRRAGIYHLRVRVPDVVRPTLGRMEVRRSLGTNDFTKARSLAARHAAQVMEAFDMIASSQFTRQEAQQLIQGCFAGMVEEDESRGGYVCESNAPDLEIAEQRGMSGDRITALREQLMTSTFDGTVTALARGVLARAGLSLEVLPNPRQTDVLNGAARLSIEEQRLFQLRLKDRLSPFAPADELFITARPAPAVPQLAASPVGFSVAEAIAEYLKYGRRQWVAKTHAARTWQLRFFAEHVGAALALDALTEHHVRSFRDAVRTLHRMHGKMKNAAFKQRQTPNVAHRISDKTASVTYEPIRAFMRWAHEVQGLVDRNPAANVRIVSAKRPKGQKSRRNFTADELFVLFTSPIFTGCKSLHRRYEPGPHVIKDAKFWIPILGYYCGARLGEIVQLHVRDVHLHGPIPYISIDEENGSDTAVGDRKHVKSHAGVRKVPLHPDVLSLGFEKFVASRAKHTGKGRIRLFHDFAYGSDLQASTVASKWFARFMHSSGLTDPKIVFHSLRHNAEDAFRDAQIPKYVIDRIVGHSDQSASAAYGEGASIEVLYEAVKAMKLKVRLPELWLTSA